jgi:iron-sulfur cluster assembly protein
MENRSRSGLAYLLPRIVACAMDITITDRALNQIRDVAADEEVDLDDAMLRVAVVPGGCSGLTYDLGWDTTLQDSDSVDVFDGIKIVMDRKSQLYLEGTELDFTDGLDGDGFHFINPQASRTCACGESFGL